MDLTLDQLDNIKIHFIVARARTGSTLLSTMLNQNKNMLSTIEEPFAYFLYPRYHKVTNWTSKTIDDYCKDFFLFSHGKLFFQFGTKEELKEILEQYKADLNYARAIRLSYLCFFPTKDKSEISTVVNKQLIMGNYLSRMAKIFPESNFLFLYRNPLDSLPRVKNQRLKKFNRSVGFYDLAVEWFYDYFLILNKKKKILSKRILDIYYEELIFHSEIELKRVCEFLNVSYEDIMVTYSDNINSKEVVDDLKTVRKNEQRFKYEKKVLLDMHEGLFVRPDANKVGKWKESISRAEADIIWSICGSTAEEIGYKKDEIISKDKPSILFYFHLLKYFVKNRIVTIIWYSSPFFVKRFLKVIKKKFLKQKED
ncbi:MAG: sulfotransferase [Crocinitomicaceae bacterium]